MAGSPPLFNHIILEFSRRFLTSDSEILGYHARPELSERLWMDSRAPGIHLDDNLPEGKLQRQA
jgi:hypothetical protein